MDLQIKEMTAPRERRGYDEKGHYSEVFPRYSFCNNLEARHKIFSLPLSQPPEAMVSSWSQPSTSCTFSCKEEPNSISRDIIFLSPSLIRLRWRPLPSCWLGEKDGSQSPSGSLGVLPQLSYYILGPSSRLYMPSQHASLSTAVAENAYSPIISSLAVSQEL